MARHAVHDGQASLEQRLILGSPLETGPTCLLVTVSLLSIYYGFAVVVGLPILDLSEQGPRFLHAAPWAATLVSIAIGYVLYASVEIPRRNATDLDTVRSVTVPTSRGDLLTAWRKALGATRALNRIHGALWAAGGLVFIFFVNPAVEVLVFPERAPRLVEFSYPMAAVYGDAIWSVVTVPALFALLGREGVRMTVGLKAVARQIEGRLTINLLDLAPLEAFGRIGLRGALFWAVIGALITLILSDPDIISIAFAPLMLAVFVTASRALLLPIRPVHEEIARLKRVEFARIAGEIVRDREELGGPAESSQGAAQRIPALLAYRRQLEEVSDYVLKPPQVGRFVLYLAIPAAGWIGGALVERGLSAIID